MRRERFDEGEAVGAARPMLVLAAGSLRLDLLDRSVRHGGRAIRLTPKEFGLLAMIVHAAPHAVARADLLARLLGCGHDPGTNAIEVHLSRLRAKLREASGPAIETVRGPGYRLAPAAPLSR